MTIYKKENIREDFKELTYVSSDIGFFLIFIFSLFQLSEIPTVVQTQGTAGEDSGENEDEEEERTSNYDARDGE